MAHSLRLAVFSVALAIPSSLVLQGCMHDTPTSPRPASRWSSPPKKPAAPRENPNLRYSRDDLDAFANELVRGYEAGASMSARLESFEPISFEMQRGRCYRIVFRFGPEASLSAKARAAISTGIRIPGDKGTILSAKVHGPGGVATAGCPQQSGTAKIDLFSAGSEEWQSHHDLGEGAVSFQVYSKPVSEQDLAANAADDARQRQEAGDFARSQCAQCRHEKDLCLDGKRSPTSGSCVSDFDSCRFAHSLSRETCD